MPLAGSVSGAPKVLIAGGISRVYSEPHVREFLERRGILVKLEEIAEFLYHFVVQVEVTRPHFHQGYASPREQFAWGTVVTGLARSGLAEGIHTLKARVECAAIDALIRRWRGVFAASGLLFERAVPLVELNFNSHHLVSHNTFTEATTTLGRFLLATQGGVYDGVVNLGSFCCAETHISEALIEPHVNGSGMACATLAVEDVSLSAPDELKLETLAAQCWRVREARAAPRRLPAAARRHKVLTTSLEGA